MIVAIDVHYRETVAKAVSIEFSDWQQSSPDTIHEVFLEEVEEYIPGQFYKRELPCILKILEKSQLSDIETIIIDGYVYLDDAGKPGLGAILFKSLNQKIPAIGVAKKRFFSNEKLVQEIVRGESQNPLFITSVGIPLNEASDNILSMAGKYRMPDLLRILDRTTKG